MTTNRLLQLITKSFAVMLVIFAFGFQVASAQTIYVSSTTGSDAFDGATATVSGASGPKATLAGALAIAADGDTIVIEAGAYAEDFSFTAATGSLTIQVTANGATAATFTGDSSIDPGAGESITLATGANSVAVADGSTTLDLVSGSLILGTDDLNFTDDVTVTVTGGTASGATPDYDGVVDIEYDEGTGADKSSGTELPADLAGGTITITMSGGGDFTTSQDLTMDAAAVTSAGDATFGDVTMAGGAADAFVHSGAGDVTMGSFTGGDSSLESTGAGDLTATGAATFATNAAATGTVAVINDGSGTMTLASLDASAVLDDDGADDAYTRIATNGGGASGDLTIGGTVSDTDSSDADEDDTMALSITNGDADGTADTATFNGAVDIAGTFAQDGTDGDVSSFNAGAAVAGDVANSGTGTVTFGANSSFGADMTNAGTLAAGSNTLEGTGDGESLDMGTVTGAGSTVVISGDSEIDDIDADGDVTISGDGAGDVAIAAASSVDGNLTISGDGDVDGATTVGGNIDFSGDNDVDGVLDVAGTGMFSGTHTIDAAGSDIDGAVDFDGDVTVAAASDLTVGSATIGASGSLDFSGADVTTNGGFDDSAAGGFTAGTEDAVEGSTLTFDNASAASFHPGPNSLVDELVFTGAGTVTMNQSISVDEIFDVDAGSTVALGDFVIRLVGDGSASTIDGSVTTASGQDGALVFEDAADLDGLGSISNMLVNIADAGERVTVGSNSATEIDFTGTITLFDEGIDVDDTPAAGDISPSGSDAEVARNIANAGTTITPSSGATGTFNDDGGTYVLTIFGGLPGAADIEYAATGITTLNVNDAGTDYTVDIDATVGNVNVQTGASWILDDAAGSANATVSGTMDIDGTITPASGAGAESVTLTGDDETHAATGSIDADLVVLATGVTINGTTDDSFEATFGNVTVGDGVASVATGGLTIADMQEVQGDLWVQADGTLSIGLAPDDGDAGTAGSGDEATIFGRTDVDDGGSLTMTSDLDADNTVDVDAGTFNFGGNTLTLTGTTAADFDADSDATFDTSGLVEFDAAGDLGTNEDAGASASTIPGLQADADITLTSDASVSGTVDVNDTADIDPTGAEELFIGGTVTLDGATSGDISAATTINGTTVTLESDYVFTAGLTFNATSVDFASDDLATPTARTLTVDGGLTHTAGAVSLNRVDIDLDSGAFDWTAGTWSATNAGDEVRMDGATLDTNDGNLSIPNLDVDTAFTVGSDDTLTITDNLAMSDDIDIDGTASAGGTVNLGAAAGTLNITADGGNVDDGDDDDATVNHAGTINIDYDGTATTGDEMPDSFNTLTISDDVTMEDSATRTPDITVNTLNLDKTAAGVAPSVGFDVDPDGDDDTSVSIAEGGSVVVSVDDPFESDSYVAPADYSLTYDGGATTTEDESWQDGETPTTVIIDIDVDLHEDRTANNFTTNTGDTFDLATLDLTVEGDLTNNGDIDATGGGNVIFGGSAMQTLTGGLDIDGVTIDNDVTLSGGNINMTAGACDPDAAAPVTVDITLASGSVTTGANAVELCHVDTGEQGFTRTGGVINGNVIKDIDFGVTSPNRVEFPTGDDSANYRPFAITFNDLTQLGTDITLTTNYNSSDPAGTNGLPISAVDELDNAFEIGRYAQDFHWEVTSAPSVTPSIDYDVEYRAAGYSNFSGEDIEKTRALRRQDGNTDNFWIKVANGNADNDNFAVSATEPVMVARNAVGAINADGVLFAIGLENNLTSTDPAALVLNAGNTEDVDLSVVFDGGAVADPAPSYTYAVTNGDAAVATGATAADVLTVTGAGEGASTVTVTATDAFGATATATVSVTVNAAFAAGTDLADLAAVNVGAADATVDGTASHSGGTAPYAYGVTTTDAAVATAAVDGAGLVTVTYVGVGTATIELTTTDAEGDTVVDSFDVTVNAAMGAAGGLANVTVDEGDTADVDASAEFTGGTTAADYSYSASSDDETVATVSVAGATVTVTGVSAYVVTAGEVTADAAPATITVTAEDDLGAMSTSTFTAEVNPVLGNVDGSGGPSPASASAALNNFLGITTLTAKQTIAADMAPTGAPDGMVTPFDAAVIFDAFFNGKVEIAANPNVEVAYGELAREDNIITIPVQLTGDLSEVVSGHFSTQIDPAFASIVGVTTELGDGWLINHTVSEEGAVLIAFAGFGDIESSGTIANIAIELTGSDVQFNLGGEGAANNNATMSIDAVEVAELPETFALHGNYPNPFNPTTSINFDLPQSADVEIHVIDMIGRQVMTLPATTIAAGANRTVQINASQLASGPYFYRVIAKMESKTLVETGRMMLVK